MPVHHSPHSPRVTSGERTYQVIMDWTRRVMQLASLATILLYGYILYGLFMGGFGQWASVTSAGDQARLAADARGAVLWVNIALGLLILSSCILFYDEEALGYTFVAAAIVLYFGIPFLFDAVLQGQVSGWDKPGHPAITIREQFRVAAFMLAVPGAVLMVRDLILRIADAGSRQRRDRTAVQYGASAREESPPPSALIGMFAKCWQLPFCWESVRKTCPIFHKRTRCWHERVGCMCEENVLRRAGNALINRHDSDLAPTGITLDAESPDGAKEKTEELPQGPAGPPPKPKDVKIPHNPNLPMAFKVERCRNCIIYNEHQRLKYQFISPLVVLGVPALAVWKFSTIYGWLETLVHVADHTVARLNPIQGASAGDIGAALTSTPVVAQYVLIACLVVIATSITLRALEYFLFKVKI